jgi:hypothetical protein
MKLATIFLLGLSAVATSIAPASETLSDFTIITTASPTLATAATVLSIPTNATTTATDALTSPADSEIAALDWNPYNHMHDPSYCIEHRTGVYVHWWLQIENFGHTKKCGAGCFERFSHK